MGLDMYLYAEKYLPRWDHTPEGERSEAEDVLGIAGLGPFQVDNGGVTVRATVGYWRKANAIHKWFVDNVQDGNDDCGTYYVGREQLEELREKCILVLAASEMVGDNVVVGQRLEEGDWKPMLERGEVVLNPKVAEQELPSAPGFFFGGTDYDQFYINDLIETVEIIDKALKADSAYVDFAYHASW